MPGEPTWEESCLGSGVQAPPERPTLTFNPIIVATSRRLARMRLAQSETKGERIARIDDG